MEVTKQRTKNPWIEFLTKYHKEHPGQSYTQSMKEAAIEYKKAKQEEKKEE